METINNNFDEFNELDDLRRQIIDLKNKVDQQGQLNEALVKRVIQSKMRGVHQTVFKLTALAIIVSPLYVFLKLELGLSWALTIFTLVMLFGSILAEHLINRMDITHMGDDLVETASKLVNMKRNRRIQHRVGLGVCVVWLAWFLYEYYTKQVAQLGSDMLFVAIIPLVIGGILGLIIGTRIYRKMQRSNDEMLDQINDLTRES